MTIDLTAANGYFAKGNHPEAKVWAGFGDPDPDVQRAAIAQAKRDIALFSKLDPDDAENQPADPTDPLAFPRIDFAVYEQALYVLENGRHVADGAAGATKFIAGRTVPDGARERQGAWIAPNAIRWLFQGRIQVSRG